jgi:hypothetical protein
VQAALCATEAGVEIKVSPLFFPLLYDQEEAFNSAY